jgi:hypothetical protein
MSVSTAAEQEMSRAPSSEATFPVALVLAPFLVALGALLGSLWLSIGMGLKACPLCYYQRTFVMGVVAVLGIGLLAGERHRRVLNLLALPLVVAGVGIAVFHVYLELSGKLECPAGVLGLGTAPQQSLAVLSALLILVVVGVVRGGILTAFHPLAAPAALVLGLLLAWGAVVSASSTPPKDYSVFDMCRPPLRQQ